jgi:GMP synthase (glutamine-hydrolysing)
LTKSVLIIDFGSQYTHLIGRKIRELGIYAEIYPPKYLNNVTNILNHSVLILSGGPDSVLNKNSPKIDIPLAQIPIPILGICYGFQYIAKEFGGEIEKSNHREYGKTIIKVGKSEFFDDTQVEQQVWMSHGDSLKTIPKGFKVLAKTKNKVPAVISNKNIFAIQFHCEVTHTEFGTQILKNYLFGLCQLKPNWKNNDLHQTIGRYFKINVKEKKPHIICAVSGGVDSTVLAFAISKYIKLENVHFIFVNNGLLRKYDVKNIKDVFKSFNLKLNIINAEHLFLKKMKNVTDPEQKRKIIGGLFIEVFSTYIRKLEQKDFYLAQGTLYTDIIESRSYHGGKSVTIKSHHNVGGLPKDLKFDVIEPFRELFKDEVRRLGLRCIGKVNKQRLDTLRDIDEIFINFLIEKDLYNKSWQAFAVLLPVKSVGVMGDERTYEETCVLRCINSVDGMTADVTNIDISVLSEVATLIVNKVPRVNKVLYDITSKPPSTIEWE